jgi:lipase maturation factor 1
MDPAGQRPLLVYDGACGFCKKWIARWRQATGSSVDYAASQEVAANFPSIPQEEFDRAVQLIRPDGSRASGAEAVLEVTAPHSFAARIARALFERYPPVRRFFEWSYGLVAAHRPVFSAATTILWGDEVRRPSWTIGTSLFLRLLALVNIIAIASWWHQAAGLTGAGGILPAEAFFAAIEARFGPSGFLFAPSLLWFDASSLAAGALCLVGLAAALAALAGSAMPACFAVLWAVQLSLIVAGQVFYNYQWDALLVEANFLAILLSPWRLRPAWILPSPPAAARLLAILLLFRLMFASGVVKLTSGDTSWADLSALDHHFLTQPLPNPLAWFVDKMPPEPLAAACAVMFLIELAVPFLFFLPRRPRHFAACATIALQIGIAVTGNYAFFNILTAALCLLLLDDSAWPRSWRRDPRPGRFLPRLVLVPACILLALLAAVPLAGAFRTMPSVLQPVAELHRLIAPFRTVNGYGLFAVMTTERREIIVQGSEDGIEWRTYEFRHKPGDTGRPPPVVAPHQPRLDWQMWFAALGTMESNPWFQSFLLALLEGRPDVLALLETNPFPDGPPRFIRAQLDTYTFTGWDSEEWWHAEPAAIYCPPASIRR